MKKRYLFAGLAAAALAVLLSGCNILFPQGSQYQNEINDLVKTQWAAYGTGKTNWGGGLALYITSPKGNFFASSGLADGTNENIHFRGASTTKSFTAVAIMLLDQQGKLNIDDKITDTMPGSTEPYVPATPDFDIPNKSAITIRQLLAHQAGVFDVGNNDVPTTESVPYAGHRYADWLKELTGEADHTFTFDELVSVDATCQLADFLPGTKFHYSNTGYSLLGKIIERVSGKSFHQFLEDELLTPNGLTATSFPHLGSDRSLPSPYTPGYAWTGGMLYELTNENVSNLMAEGNIITTPANLAVWVKKWISAQSGLDAAHVREMMDCQPTGEEHRFYGLGCNYTPGLGYGHNGGHPSYMTMMRHDPTQEVSVVVFCSVMNADDVYGQLNFMYDLGYRAKNLLGYSTAESGS
jgi:D-alanyl-D-alanine carboxypeptidase